MLSVSISHPVMEPRHERGGGPKRCSFIEFSDSGASRRNLAFFLANVWSLGINWMGFFPFFSSLLFVNARSEVLEYFGKVMASGWRFIKSNENFSSEKRQGKKIFSTFDRWLCMYIYILSKICSLHLWISSLVEGIPLRRDLWSARSVFFSIKNPIERFFTIWYIFITARKISRVIQCVVETKTYFTQRWNFSKLRYV